MPYTLKNLKDDVRATVFPAGEASNLFIPHNRYIVDALIDIQTWVECFQQDNTTIVPQCATTYNCGITAFDFPRAMIKKLSVIDKINPTTKREDAEAADDWCSEIFYDQVDACVIQNYWARSRKAGCCLPIAQFFAIPFPLCNKGRFPVPTDEGVPEGLPILPLGYHYPQESTNAKGGRALKGYWAIERGKIMVVPWIQSTETIIVRWDGIKREWADADLVEQDPKLVKAVIAYLQWQTSSTYGDIPGDPVTFERAYSLALQDMIHDCREETRQRACEPSFARGSSLSLATLFYNDAQQYTATCPPNKTGSPKTVVIPADTFGSALSKADANQQAFNEARIQAESLLVCADIPTTYYNAPQSFTAQCEQEEGAPVPEGSQNTVTIPAGQFSSIVSQADADAQALAEATSQAKAQAGCVWWNREQSFTAACDITKTIAAHTYSSTISQADADSKAQQAAKSAAESECPDSFQSTPISRQFLRRCSTSCHVTVNVTAAAGLATSTVSQNDANQQAANLVAYYGNNALDSYCSTNRCGTYNLNLG